MVVVVAERDAAAAISLLSAAGEAAYRIGSIRARAVGEAQTVVV